MDPEKATLTVAVDDASPLYKIMSISVFAFTVITSAMEYPLRRTPTSYSSSYSFSKIT